MLGNVKSLETLAAERALTCLRGVRLEMCMKLMRNWNTAPEHLVVEYAASWNSYSFAVYGFKDTHITFMINFDNLESLMRFVEAALVWKARWVLHESMNFATVTTTEDQNGSAILMAKPRQCKLRCFMCDEELKLPNDHLLAVKCDRFNVDVPLWTHKLIRAPSTQS